MSGGGDPHTRQTSGGGSEGTGPFPTENRSDTFGITSQEDTLDWVRRFYPGMTEQQSPPPRGDSMSPTGQQLPPPGSLEATWNLANYTLQETTKHKLELGGLVESVRKMRAELAGEIQFLAAQGKRYDQQFAPPHTQVKLAGDVFRTMRGICRAPELTQANLADFDQWSDEMLHTIDTARTNEPSYNRVNIEFIYGNISLDLRSQAEGHVPEKLTNIALMKPADYLKLLAQLYTPADHLSTKRGEFEGRKQLATESPLTYLSVMYRLYNRAKYQDPAFLVERYLMGLLNESLKLQIVMHHRKVSDYNTLRDAVVESHSAMIKAVRVGKGTPPFSLAGLSQQSDVASQETSLQWKRRARMGNVGSAGAEAMDLTQIEGPDDDPGNMLFFMGPDDVQLRDMETTEDLEYWEGELDDEQITIAELVQGNWAANRTCYHCREVGHMKAQCPQRRRGNRRTERYPTFRGRGMGRGGRQVTETQRGRGTVKTWNRGTSRGRGRPFNGRSPNNQTGVAQITEMPDCEEVEADQPSQNPERDF